MCEKLIVAVCVHPELYDTLAWKKVSEEDGEPVESCRKKWKSLRDTYLKERRKETERSSGSAAVTGKRWKYSAVLSFLDPFVTPRETLGNMEEVVEEHRAAEYDLIDNQAPDREAAAGQSELEDQGLLTAKDTHAHTPPPPSEHELFLKSLLPSLERLPPQKKQFVKFQIHKLICEATMFDDTSLENGRKQAEIPGGRANDANRVFTLTLHVNH
uniref:MADF domain-containing protein n=1 Tax=Stegastes partitus TaxID=144197 RepID=A0A3B5AB51_9TELE